MPELVVEPNRRDLPETGICVRAMLDGRWGSHDIAHLTRESLIAWLTEDPGPAADGSGETLAVRVVAVLLGHSAQP